MKIVRINAIWCSGCIVMKKVWNQVIEKYPELEIVNYDYDMDEEVVKEYNVGTTLPVAIFYKDDKEIKRLNGEKTYMEVVKVIEELL